MSYSAELSKQLIPVDETGLLLGTSPTRLVMSVQSTTDFVDDGLFVYEINAVTGEQTYSHVATPVDLTAFDLVDTGVSYLRKPQIDLTYRTADLAADDGLAITLRLSELCTAMNNLAGYASPIIITVP